MEQINVRTPRSRLSETLERARRGGVPADDPRVRDRAEQDIKRFGPSACEAVKRLAESNDPELRFRARRMLAGPSLHVQDETLRAHPRSKR